MLIPFSVIADEPVIDEIQDSEEVTTEVHPYAEFSDLLINWPEGKELVPVSIHPIMEVLHKEVEKRSVTNADVCLLIEEILHEEEEKPRWKKFLRSYGITMGSTAIFSSGVVFAFLSCTFAWYIPTMIKKWWNSTDGWRALRHQRTYTDESIDYMTQDELNIKENESLDDFEIKREQEPAKGNESPLFHPSKHHRTDSIVYQAVDVPDPNKYREEAEEM